MGVSINGGMMVGCSGRDFNIDVPYGCDLDEEEYANDIGIERYSKHYDADDDDCWFGFLIDNINIEDIDIYWIAGIKELADKFEKATGVKAMLIGSQHVY